MLSTRDKFLRRKRRTRNKIAERRNVLPRLSVFRSNNHIYAQIIDDQKRQTLVAACTLEKTSKTLKKTSNIEAASHVGKVIAERALSKGIDQVVFDRGGYLFHGRVKAIAMAARENGLKF